MHLINDSTAWILNRVKEAAKKDIVDNLISQKTGEVRREDMLGLKDIDWTATSALRRGKVAKGMKRGFTPGEVQSVISAAKNARIDPQTYATLPGASSLVSRVFELYQVHTTARCSGPTSRRTPHTKPRTPPPHLHLPGGAEGAQRGRLR